MSAALSPLAVSTRPFAAATAGRSRVSSFRSAFLNPSPLIAKANAKSGAIRSKRAVRADASADKVDEKIRNESFLNRAADMVFDPYSRVSLQGGPDGTGRGPFSNIFWGFLGAFVGMTALGIMDMFIAPLGLPFMIGSWGTLSVLLFASPGAPVLNRWNIVLGHMGAAAIVWACISLMGPTMICRSLAFALTIAFMMKVGCVHPPGGALVLICIDAPKFQALGPLYIVWPALLGALFLVAVAEVINYLKAKYVFELSDIFGGGSKPTAKLA